MSKLQLDMMDFDLDRNEVIGQAISNYESANSAVLMVWSELKSAEIDFIVGEQKKRLEHIMERVYNECEKCNKGYIVQNALNGYELANQHLHQNWTRITFGQRLELIRKQYGQLEDLRRATSIGSI